MALHRPSRFEAQSDAVSLIFSAKTQANPESSVGLMSMGGRGTEVLVTLTTDFGKILDGLHRTKIRGSAHLSTAISVAMLALRHRQNTSQHPRIIVFTCSPIDEDEKTLLKLARRVKKSSVCVDFVVFGELDEAQNKKLEAFTDVVQGGDGSHMAVIPPGPHLLSDALVTTPILSGDGMPGAAGGMGNGEAGAEGGAAGGQGNFDFGVDSSMDPELALALRMSYEEEKARVEKEKKDNEEKEKKTTLEGIEEGKATGASVSAAPAEKKKENDNEPKKDTDDADKMDTT